MPYELLLKDFSKTNYSSARAALNEAWRFFRGKRKWLASYFYAPVYALWLEEAVNAGLVDAPDFYENWEAYCRCFWIGDGRGYVDPLKEQQASRGRMEDRTSTLELECAEQGLDWEEVLEQRARELQREKELEGEYGIKFPSPTQQSQPKDDKEDDASNQMPGDKRPQAIPA
jgi:capsid protein